MITMQVQNVYNSEYAWAVNEMTFANLVPISPQVNLRLGMFEVTISPRVS